MSRLSPKSSLLAGVSAVVLATAVSSGGLAADITSNSANGPIWGFAPGASSGVSTASSGDNLILEGGQVSINHSSRVASGGTRGRAVIGELKSGTSGAGMLHISSSRSNEANIDVTIGSIIKQGSRAVDLSLLGSPYNLNASQISGGSRKNNLKLTVTNDAHVRNLSIDMANIPYAGKKAEAVFSGNLIADGTTEIKAGNNSTTAVNAILELKGDADFKGGVTLTDTAGGQARLKLSGSAPQEIKGNIKSATGRNSGTITVENAAGVTFEGNLGESGDNNGLNKLTLAGHATPTSASKATFEGNLYLGNGLEFGQNTQITLNGTSLQTVGGNLTSADGGNYGHIIIGSDTNDAEVTFTGALGASGTNNALDNLTLHGDSTATFGSNVYLDNGLTLGNGTVTFNGSGTQTVDAAITNGTNAQGSLEVNKDGGTVTFEQAIGANGAALQKVTLTDGKTIFEDAVHAKVIDVDSADGTTFDVAVTSDSFTLSGVAQFKADVTVNEGLHFDGSDGSAVFIGTNRQSFSGAITATPNTEGTGRIVVANEDGNAAGVIFNDDIGASNAALKAVVLNNGTTTFKGKLFARGIDVNTAGTTFHGSVTSGNEFKLSQAATFGGDVTAGGTNGLRFNGANGAAIFDGKDKDDNVAAQTVTGKITTGAPGQGTITVNNAQGVTFKGDLGGDGTNEALNTLTLNASTNATLEKSGYFANGVTVNSGATLTLKGSSDQTLSGAISGAGGVIVDGVAREVKFDNAISASTFKFGANATADTRATFGGSTARTITPAITTDAGGRGAITVTNTGGVTFKGNLGAYTDTNTHSKLASVTLSGGGDATFQGHVYLAGNLELGDGSSVTFNGRNADDTADAAQTVMGNVTSAGGGNYGDMTVINSVSVTFKGDVGATGEKNALNSVKLNNGATTFEGNLFARNIDINTTGATTFKGDVSGEDEFKFTRSNSVTFSGDNAQTITGDITRTTGASAVNFTINNSEGVTFAGQLGTKDDELASVSVKEDAKVTFDAPVYLSGDLTAEKNSTITLGKAFGERTGDDANDAFLTVGDFKLDSGVDEANKVTIAFDSSFSKGKQRIINKNLESMADKIEFEGSHLISYETDGTIVTARANSVAKVAQTFKISEEQATVFVAADAVARDALPDSSPIRKLLQEAAQTGNEAKGKTLAEQLAPQTTALSGAATAVVSTGTQVAGVFTDRLSVLRGGETLAQRGFATGGHGLNKAFWLKPFGSWGKQTKNTKQNVAGYSTTAKGLAVGVDAPVTDRVRVGTALAYSTSNIKGKGAGKDNTDVKSWQVSLYGDYSTARYYVEGQLGLGRNDVSTASKVAFLTRKADYDTTSVTASVGGGLPLNLNATTTLTPTAGLSWTRVGSANYTTTGASVLNQKISVAAIDAVVGTLGTQLQRKITRGAGTVVPTARVGLSYDFAGKPTTASGKFTGGGDRFKVKGAKVKKLSGTAGLGLTYAGPRWSIGADYDLTARTGYQGHTARVSAKVKF